MTATVITVESDILLL